MELVKNKVSGKLFVVLDDTGDTDFLVITPEGYVKRIERRLFLPREPASPPGHGLTQEQLDKYTQYIDECPTFEPKSRADPVLPGQRFTKTATPERSGTMGHDPFGNLMEWGCVLQTLEDLTDRGILPECQPGLIRILRYRGNWRLREEVLRRVGEIPFPAEELTRRVLAILDDDNIYHEARILAGDALVRMVKNAGDDQGERIGGEVLGVVEKLKSIPHPPLFEEALSRFRSEIAASTPPRN